MKDIISTVLDNQDAIARRDFCARANETETEEDEFNDGGDNFTAPEEDLEWEPESFVGLHPNHRPYAMSKLAYQRDNHSLAICS